MLVFDYPSKWLFLFGFLLISFHLWNRGDTAGIVDAIRLVVLALRAKVPRSVGELNRWKNGLMLWWWFMIFIYGSWWSMIWWLDQRTLKFLVSKSSCFGWWSPIWIYLATNQGWKHQLESSWWLWALRVFWVIKTNQPHYLWMVNFNEQYVERSSRYEERKHTKKLVIQDRSGTNIKGSIVIFEPVRFTLWQCRFINGFRVLPNISPWAVWWFQHVPATRSMFTKENI